MIEVGKAGKAPHIEDAVRLALYRDVGENGDGEDDAKYEGGEGEHKGHDDERQGLPVDDVELVHEEDLS